MQLQTDQVHFSDPDQSDESKRDPKLTFNIVVTFHH